VDSSFAKRELRDAMRKLGMEADRAADISEARTLGRANFYNFVFISTESECGRWDKFCEDIHGTRPSQQLAFLLGKPEYLATSPSPDAAVSASEDGGHVLLDNVKAALASHVAETASQSWGVEACR
jgi:hypothetical protein